MIRSARFVYVVQERDAHVRQWHDYGTAGDGSVKAYARHADALAVAKAETKRPDNRGHDHYYRVQQRTRSQETK